MARCSQPSVAARNASSLWSENTTAAPASANIRAVASPRMARGDQGDLVLEDDLHRKLLGSVSEGFGVQAFGRWRQARAATRAEAQSAAALTAKVALYPLAS